ncbi:MAG TPA: hypothetical protein VGE43_02545, partial [Acidimicrobiales bacterium]
MSDTQHGSSTSDQRPDGAGTAADASRPPVPAGDATSKPKIGDTRPSRRADGSAGPDAGDQPAGDG